MSSPTPQQFCLRWNNHSSALLSVFEQLLQTEIFTDVTLAIDGVLLKAHKLVLSACSPYFQMIFASHNSKHPIVILKDVHYQDMRALLDFMYRGEVSVDQDRLPQFLHLAETLRIRGLAEVGDYSQQPDSIFKCESSIPDADRVQKGPADSQYPVTYSPYQRYQLNSPYPPDPLQSPNDLLKRPGSPFQSYGSRRKRGRPPKIGQGTEYADPMDVLDVKVDSGFSGIANVYPPRHSSTPLTPQSTEGQDEENSRDLMKNRTPPQEMGVKKEWTPPIEIQAGSSKEDSHGTNHSGDINGDESISRAQPHVWIPSEMIQKSQGYSSSSLRSALPYFRDHPIQRTHGDEEGEHYGYRPSMEHRASQLRACLPSDVTLTPIKVRGVDQINASSIPSRRDSRPIRADESRSSTEEFVCRIIDNVRRELAISGEIDRRGYSKGTRWN